MGGKGSGGARAGAGRKPKDDAARALGGWAHRRTKKQDRKVHARGALTIAPPGDLPAEQRALWDELAPQAMAQQTLTVETVLAFRDLCEAIVLKRAMLARIESDGLTYVKVTVDGAGTEHSELKAHPLISQHRGMMQRVEQGLARFRLAPIGKAIIEPEPPADEWADFDKPTVQ